MKTTDPRDLTFQELQSALEGTRIVIWEWLRHYGPATTSQIADGTGIGLLTVRPRVSELAALGFVECTGRLKREGIYQFVTVEQVRNDHARSRDLQLNLSL